MLKIDECALRLILKVGQIKGESKPYCGGPAGAVSKSTLKSADAKPKCLTWWKIEIEMRTRIYSLFMFPALVFALGSCAPKSAESTSSNLSPSAVDSIPKPADPGPPPSPLAKMGTQAEAMVAMSKDILKLAEAGDYEGIAKFIHPVEGLRFSPYTNVDEGTDRIFTVDEFRNHFSVSPTKKLMWGTYDPSGEPIKLTLDGYFKKFACDKPYLSKGKFAYNETIGHSTIINNIAEFYPEAVFVEAYFGGDDLEQEPYAWASVRLVYQQHEGRFFLLGWVHDAWAT
jgi:hypothetical protein